MLDSNPTPSSPFTRHLSSAVEFATQSRIHVAIAVRDVERSLPFYRALFGQAPSKLRPGYAKFEVAEPPVNFTLNAAPDAVVATSGPRFAGPRHFGIQVKSTEAVMQARARLVESGLEIEIEDQVSCCYAVQDKVWAVDPDGHRWEIFVVTQADAPRYERIPKCAESDAETSACCAPSCCTDEPSDADADADADATVDAEPEPSCCAPACCA